MMTRWTVIEKAVKNMSTMSPNFLLKDKTERGLADFIKRLQKKREDLLTDYISYVATTFPSNITTETSMCVRYSHRVTWLAINRLIDSLQQLPWSPTQQDIHTYFSFLCIPSKEVYHHPIVVITADLVHELFKIATLMHIENLTLHGHDSSPEKRIDGKRDTDPNIAPICSSLQAVNDLLSYAAVIDSYPVVPEDLAGILVPTTQKIYTRALDILSPGVDNRIHACKPKDVRTCISCKVDNLSIGLTDIEEQHIKLPCRCLFDSRPYISGQFYDTGYVCRASAIVRLLLFNKRVVPAGIGCSCSDHNDVFAERIMWLKKALDSAKVAV